MSVFKLKSWHFLISIIAVLSISYITARFKQPDNIHIGKNTVKHIDAFCIKEIIYTQPCAILFTDRESQADKIVLSNLNKLKRECHIETSFYYVSINDSLFFHNDYSISGTPSILLFHNGRETNRIMGVISYSNLEMIIKRFEKQL